MATTNNFYGILLDVIKLFNGGLMTSHYVNLTKRSRVKWVTYIFVPAKMMVNPFKPFHFLK